jgi:nucleoside-diphosphate-sugar epimerase
LSDYSELAKAVASTKPEVIVHCATHYVYSHEPSDIAPMFDANLHFGTHILEALRTSDAQFDNISTYFQHQRTAKGQSTSIYAISKSAFSSIVQWYGGNTALKITDLTLFDTYGPGDERKKLIPNLLACARSGTTLELRSASAAVDLCYVDDVVAAIDLVVSKRKSGSWSVRSGHPITVADIARTTEEITGRRVVDKFSDSLVVAGLPMEVPPMLPGWRPNVELREGIARCWQAVKDDA